MNTRTSFRNLAGLIIGAVCALATAACGGELLRTGRAPVYLVVTDVTAGMDGQELASFLLSDVITGGSAVNDNVRVGLRLEPKNPTATTTAINSVTLTRYDVVFRRTDGRNRPGTDVPYGFSGALSSTLAVGGEGGVTFVLVRHQSKREPPLANIEGGGGLRLLSTIADITIYGRDQNGNDVMVKASIDVHFGDFADPE